MYHPDPDLNRTFDDHPVQHIDAEEARQLLEAQDMILLDIRTPREFQASRIEGAINIDFYDPGFIEALSQLDPEKTYFLYCRSGNRTYYSLRVFESLGFKKIYHLYGGIIDWVASGFELVQGEG